MGENDRKQPETEQAPQQQAGTEGPEEVRHKGPDRTTQEERHSGPQPEGNGGTGAPAAFPPHN